jgi:cytochrome P450
MADFEGMTSLRYDTRLKVLFDYFAERRAVEAVGPSEQTNVWEVFRYAEAVQVLGDHETFSSDKRALIPEDQPHLAMAARGNFIGIDPPLHTKFRSLVNRAFTPRIVGQLEPRIRQTADQLLDNLVDTTGTSGSVDLGLQYASQLSAGTIAALFGIPRADHTMFWRWSDGLLGSRPFGELGVVDQVAMRRLGELVREASEYLLVHIAERRADPKDDLTSRLTEVEVDGKRLDDHEIVGVIGMFLIAGHMSTSLLIGNTIMCLDEHPDAMAAVRADRALLQPAIEEVVRWRPPLVRDQRVARRTVEIGGTTIPAGGNVCVWLASANRDETVFPAGDRFDIRRDPNPHRGFGHGIHFCMGAALSVMETAIAVDALLRRFDDLSVMRDGPVEFHKSIGMIGPVRLPVTFQVTAG